MFAYTPMPPKIVAEGVHVAGTSQTTIVTHEGSRYIRLQNTHATGILYYSSLTGVTSGNAAGEIGPGERDVVPIGNGATIYLIGSVASMNIRHFQEGV